MSSGTPGDYINDEKIDPASFDESIVWYMSETQKSKVNDSDIAKYNVRIVDKDFIKTNLIVQRHSFICRKVVSADKVISIIQKTDNVILYLKGKTVIGLLLFKFLGDSIYIDIICNSEWNKGGGKKLMSVILDYWASRPELKSVKLYSMADPFYTSFGFVKHAFKYDKDVEYNMTLSKIGGGGFIKVNRTLRKVRRYKKSLKTRKLCRKLQSLWKNVL